MNVDEVVCAAFDLFFSGDGDRNIAAILRLLQTSAAADRNYCKTRIQSYEKTISNYNDNEFKEHFRLSKRTFDTLHSMLYQEVEVQQPGRPEIATKTQLLVTLWMLGNKDVYRKLPDRFNIGRSTAHGVFFRTVANIIELRNVYIKWPNEVHASEMSNFFQQKTGFPNIVGLIDGTHFPIYAPKENKEKYINRKGYYSLACQLVCNHKKMFIDVECGYPGSWHDARIFRRSNLGQQMSTGEKPFPYDSHLLGDSAYPLRNNLLVPFRDNGRLTDAQVMYNTMLSRNRIFIEHAIGLLKGRFRCLQNLQLYNTINIPQIILACCILHNICISEKEEDIELFEEDHDENSDDSNISSLDGHIRTGVEKRNYIATLFQ